MKLGVHQIKHTSEYASYFVHRPFGNYLIFADALPFVDHDFLESKGGLYKQFIEDVDNISLAQCDLFSKFGAAAVGNFDEDSFHPKIKLEKFGSDFVDRIVKFNTNENKNFVVLKQGDLKVLFLGRAYYYSSGEIFVDEVKKTDEVLDHFEAQGVDMIFFSHFSGDHILYLSDEMD